MGERPSHVAYELLARSHSPDTADRLFKERVVERPLLLRSAESTVNARAERRQKREEKAAAVRARQSKKPKPLSAKQKRALCIYDIPKEQQKYAIYEPLHEMWCAYMREVLDLDRKDSKLGHGEAAQKFVTVQVAGPKIVSADFHGAMVEVARSRCVSRVGLKGIVVKDTKHTFEMITATNKLKIVPKEYSIFRLKVPVEGKKVDEFDNQKHLIFELHGPQFANRAPERATKKFKQHILPEL